MPILVIGFTDMGIGVSRPGHDAWVGVDPSVGHYTRALEVEINNLEVLRDVERLEHKEEAARLRSGPSR